MKRKRSFGYYADDSGISDSDNNKKMLLHYAGMSVQDIFDTVPSPSSPASVLMLDDHFKNEPTYALERHNFRLLWQLPFESTAQFIYRLSQQAKLCKFSNNGEHIVGQFVEGVVNSGLQRKVLEKIVWRSS